MDDRKLRDLLRPEILVGQQGVSLSLERGVFVPSKLGHGVNRQVQAFYEGTPFPNYNDIDTAARLVALGRRSLMPVLLDENLPQDATILDVGCGTGQLVNYFGLCGRAAVGTDFCLPSLQCAADFRDRHRVAKVQFVQSDLFDSPFRDGAFDVVLCQGVLHHTKDPARAFAKVSDLVKPGGYFICGLYNRYARIPLVARRWLSKVLGARILYALDPVLRRGTKGSDRVRAWLNDQYRHPEEHRHTVDEVLAWFHDADFTFVNAIPSIVPWENVFSDGGLLSHRDPGRWIDRFICQMLWVKSLGHEGGLFVIIGRKN